MVAASHIFGSHVIGHERNRQDSRLISARAGGMRMATLCRICGEFLR